jgi:hypothetical protein
LLLATFPSEDIIIDMKDRVTAYWGVALFSFVFEASGAILIPT